MVEGALSVTIPQQLPQRLQAAHLSQEGALQLFDDDDPPPRREARDDVAGSRAEQPGQERLQRLPGQDAFAEAAPNHVHVLERLGECAVDQARLAAAPLSVDDDRRDTPGVPRDAGVGQGGHLGLAADEKTEILDGPGAEQPGVDERQPARAERHVSRFRDRLPAHDGRLHPLRRRFQADLDEGRVVETRDGRPGRPSDALSLIQRLAGSPPRPPGHALAGQVGRQGEAALLETDVVAVEACRRGPDVCGLDRVLAFRQGPAGVLQAQRGVVDALLRHGLARPAVGRRPDTERHPLAAASSILRSTDL